jgi:nucleoside 2-deoxyribosyltransferase
MTRTRPTTIYVAGPMTGIPEFNYPAFNSAAERLRGLGHRVLNPADSEDYNPTPGTPQAWDWYMRHALRMVLQADALALLPGWETSRGATLEVDVATALGIPVKRLAEWLEAAA